MSDTKEIKHVDASDESSRNGLIAVNSISATNSKCDFALVPFYRRAVGPNDVHIKITYSGICHSDIHTAKGEWGEQTYPLCVGHEIIGDVVTVGDKVTKFKVGDKAGVGCFTDSCGECTECEEGDNNYCSGITKGTPGRHKTYGCKVDKSVSPSGVSQGGYSSDIVVEENHVLRVPEFLYCAAGAPLLCAGITCYSPFKHYGLKAGMSLGVVGLGGLGHMALKIGVAMGCNVTVISRSYKKKEAAMKLGATQYVSTANADEMKAASKSLNMIYNSIAFPHDVRALLGLLRSSGTMIMVGGIPQSMNVTSFDLIGRRLKLVGSCIGGIKETQEMLDFCAEHKVLSDIEIIKPEPEEVLKAWDRAIKGDVKFRFVIDTAKMAKGSVTTRPRESNDEKDGVKRQKTN